MVSEIAEEVIDTTDNTLWWNQNSICTEHHPSKESRGNILKLFIDEGWAEAGLEWQPKEKKK